MGLDMKTRKKICAAIFKRYQKAGKKGKAKILDEFAEKINFYKARCLRPLLLYVIAISLRFLIPDLWFRICKPPFFTLFKNVLQNTASAIITICGKKS